MTEQEIYMQRCLQLAQNGLGATYPNPLVGCVIVHNNKIIGEGWHTQSGKAHAEVNAIASVSDVNLLKDSTLYVNLEPCNHYGKTPPCSELIIKHKISKVVVGTIDIFSEVSGKGISRLREAGCEVKVGVLEEKCKEINKRFFTFHSKKRPYIILKWASSCDGFLAPKAKEKKQPVWITNELSRQLVHKWRSEEQAILVGKNTILEDNPSLTTRDWFGKNPLRIVIDNNFDVKNKYHIYNDLEKTLVFTKEDINLTNKNVFFRKIDFSTDVLQQIMDFLYQENIQSVIIEGGKYTLQQFINANLWDEARVFQGRALGEGILAPKISFMPKKTEKLGEDILYLYENN